MADLLHLLVGVAAAAQSPAARSVVAAAQRPPGAEQLDVRAAGHEILGSVEQLDDVRAVGADSGDADDSSPVQVQMVDLGDRDLQPTTQLGHDRSHDGTLALQRVHVAKQQVELERPSPHVPSPAPSLLSA
jgi:hypothetical protein